MANSVKILPEEAVELTGEMTAGGQSTSGVMTEVALNSSSWTLLPTTPLTRNAISIQNQGTVQVKYNYRNDVGYVGKIIEEGESANIDITENIVVYGRSASGTPTVLVEEVG